VSYFVAGTSRNIFILTLACLKQCWGGGGLPGFASLVFRSSFLFFCSWLTHLFSLRTLQLSHKYLGQRQSPPFVTLFKVYISFSHSQFREIIVPEKSFAKMGANHRTLKNSQPWPSSQNKIINFENHRTLKNSQPWPSSQNKIINFSNTVIFITILPDLKLHPYTHHNTITLIRSLRSHITRTLPYPHLPFKSRPPLQYLEHII
jgi:hypothetical protein